MWMPINLLIVRALLNLHRYYGENFKVECPTGSGRLLTLLEVSEEIARRIFAIFQRGPDGRRPLYGGTNTFQTDPHWRDLIRLRYFTRNGAGLGQPSDRWTGGVSLLTMLTRSAASMRRVSSRRPRPVFAVWRHASRRAGRRSGRGAPAAPVDAAISTSPHYDHSNLARKWLMLLSHGQTTSGAWRIERRAPAGLIPRRSLPDLSWPPV
jgi:hypothetical protein